MGFKKTKNQLNSRGFSLVELIVVIAIMAVLVAVLAPALLQYVERSRAQKDDSAMGEVTNAIQLALADQNAYDEALTQVLSGKNGGSWAASCYVDKETPNENNKVDTKAPNEYIYSDAERKADEIAYILNGQMRGLTITFSPSKIGSSNKKQFVLADGIVNSDNDTTLSELNAETDDTSSQGQIYNKLRAAIGDPVPVTSQTYRNSPYTVFVRMGTTGGNDASKQDAIKVYGQWGGTNLAKTASSTGGSGNTGNTGNNEEPGGGPENPGGQNDGPIEVVYFDEDGNVSTSETSANYELNSDATAASKFMVEIATSSVKSVKVQEDVSDADTLTVIDKNEDYTVSAFGDCAVVALTQSYLNGLDEGSHRIEIVTTSGTADASINISAATTLTLSNGFKVPIADFMRYPFFIFKDDTKNIYYAYYVNNMNAGIMAHYYDVQFYCVGTGRAYGMILRDGSDTWESYGSKTLYTGINYKGEPGASNYQNITTANGCNKQEWYLYRTIDIVINDMGDLNTAFPAASPSPITD